MAGGDVANLYGELDHKSVDDAMDWLLDNSPTWLHRRVRVNMGVSVTPWGLVTEDRSLGENNKVYFDLKTIREVCRYDNKYCLIFCICVYSQAAA